jgi:hypothetical protein
MSPLPVRRKAQGTRGIIGVQITTKYFVGGLCLYLRINIHKGEISLMPRFFGRVLAEFYYQRSKSIPDYEEQGL